MKRGSKTEKGHQRYLPKIAILSTPMLINKEPKASNGIKFRRGVGGPARVQRSELAPGKKAEQYVWRAVFVNACVEYSKYLAPPLHIEAPREVPDRYLCLMEAGRRPQAKCVARPLFESEASRINER